MTLDKVRRAIADAGLSYRGAFHPLASDLPDGVAAQTLALIGIVGRQNWHSFATLSEAADGRPDPLDRWSRRVVTGIAEKLGATALFPFGGPPWMPFQRWACKAEPLHPSPLGMLIHPDWGLWHAWRGALAFDHRLDLPEPDLRPSPCETCAGRPCLSACPVGAFTSNGYNVAACVAHLETPAGADCMDGGCRARRACPVGSVHRYDGDQAKFHLHAFRQAQVSSRTR